MVTTRAQNWSPDMILKAYDVKFHETKDEIPPRPVHLQKVKKQKQCEGYGLKKVKQNNVDNVGSPPARLSVCPSGESGERSPRKEKKGGMY